jgi:hypothetical protein
MFLGPEIASTTRIQSSLIFLLKEVSVHCFIAKYLKVPERSVRYLYVMSLPGILVTRHQHVLSVLCGYCYNNLLNSCS